MEYATIRVSDQRFFAYRIRILSGIKKRMNPSV